MMASMSLALVLFAALQAAPAPLPPDAAPDAASTGTAPEGAGRDYRVGPEDVLQIAVYGHPDLTQTVALQADGSFAFPLIGRVEASEMAAPELERKLHDMLARGFIRDPQVAVVVQQYRSKIVFVVGEVMRPGAYPLVGTRRLLEVLAKAGPMTERAGTEVVVVRARTTAPGPVLPAEIGGAGSGAQADVMRVDLRDIQAGDLGKDIALLPRDTVFIPAAPRVFVSGSVPHPGGYAFAPGTTVRQAVSLAGGSAGSPGRIRVLREIGGRAQPVQLGLDDLVQAGDTIIVRGKLF
jgi:polysaccharide export outer membrane protein